MDQAQQQVIATAVAAALAASGAGGAEPTPQLTEAQVKEHEAHMEKVNVAKAAREEMHMTAAKVIAPTLVHDDLNLRAAALFIRSGVQGLAWSHHRNRAFIDTLSARIAKEKMKGGFDGSNGNLANWEQMVADNYDQNDSIEVLALAGQIRFDEIAMMIEDETKQPFTLSLDFDISETAYAGFNNKEDVRAAKTRKDNAAMTSTANDLVHLATPSASLMKIAEQAEEA